MRWLLIGLLVSLGALLVAAAGMARHIWRERLELRAKTAVNPGAQASLVSEIDPEL